MKNLTKIVIVVFWLTIGVIIGLLIPRIHYLSLKTEVGFGDMANFILALVVAVIIPIMLNPWLDSERHIKDFLIEDIKNCLIELKER